MAKHRHGTAGDRDVFLRDRNRVFPTYFTTGRGVEYLGTNWALLDVTPLGRQENWEDFSGRVAADASVRLVAPARGILSGIIRGRRGPPARR